MRGQPPVPTVDLTRLHDLALPTPVSYAPATAGWYVLGALLVLAFVWIVLRWRAHRRAGRYRRAALAELATIEARLKGDGRAAAIVELDVLVKRVALAAYPRSDVAALSGDAWLAFLDRSSGGSTFSAGDGRALADLPYASKGERAAVPPERAAALAAMVRNWIRSHRVPV